MNFFEEKIALIKDKAYSQLIENFFSLSILNGLSFILPLLTLPYLVRVVGVERYGTISFVLVLVQYINMFSSYGFSFSATRQISINREDRQKVSEIFSAVIVIRLIISTICIILLISLMPLVNKLRQDWILYLYSAGIVIGDIFIPLWLFQGMEKMKFVTIVNITSKIVFTLLIFVAIRQKSDYKLVPLLSSAGTVCASIISIYLSIKMFRIEFRIPSHENIVRQVKEGWPLFVSLLGMNFYRNANPLILGIVTNDFYVGLYTAAEKIIKAVQSVITPLTDSLYPIFSKKFSFKSDIHNLNTLFRIGKYYVVILMFLTILIYALSGNVILYYLGSDMQSSILNIRIMSFVILFGGLNYFLGIIGLVNMGYEKWFTFGIIISGILSLCLCVSLSPFIFDKAAAIAMLSAEVTLFIFIFSYIRLILRKSSNIA